MHWLPPAFAQDCSNTNTVRGAGTIPVLIDRGEMTLADSGKRFNDYAIRLGAFNEFDQICVMGEDLVTLVFDLSASGDKYVFEDIRFGFPNAFAPSDSPFKLSVVGKQAVAVYFKGSKATLGRSFKYDLILRNIETGERLILDPQVINTQPN